MTAERWGDGIAIFLLVAAEALLASALAIAPLKSSDASGADHSAEQAQGLVAGALMLVLLALSFRLLCCGFTDKELGSAETSCESSANTKWIYGGIGAVNLILMAACMDFLHRSMDESSGEDVVDKLADQPFDALMVMAMVLTLIMIGELGLNIRNSLVYEASLQQGPL